MNLDERISAARRATDRTIMLEHCLSNPDTPFGAFMKDLDEDLQDILMSLTPADFVGAKAPGKGKPKSKSKSKSKSKPAAGAAKTGTAEVQVAQANVTSEIMRWVNHASGGDCKTMAELRKLTGGTPMQIKTALKSVGDSIAMEGKGRGTKYIVTAEVLPDDDEEAGEDEEAA
jgi:hypothetical protein